MKATGIVRKVDELGRIVVPKELRDTRDIKNDDALEIFVDDDFILLKKYSPQCIFCGEAAGVKHYKGKVICDDCIVEFIKYFT